VIHQPRRRRVHQQLVDPLEEAGLGVRDGVALVGLIDRRIEPTLKRRNHRQAENLVPLGYLSTT
jgi:hypothetical protein